MNNKFLGPVRFDPIREIYNIDYFTFTDTDSSLFLEFSNNAIAHILVPINTNLEFVVSAPKFCMRNSINVGDNILEFKVDSIDINLYFSSATISDFYFKPPSVIDSSNKIEYSEYYYSDWAQILQFSNFPTRLSVIGIELDSRLVLYSIPGTLTNYLMQLIYAPNQILSKVLITEVVLNSGRVLKIYSITLEFSKNNLLYISSISDYEKLLTSEKNKKYFSGVGLESYGIYDNYNDIYDYISLNLNTKITQYYTLIELLNMNSHLHYSLLNNLIFNLIGNQKTGALLKRIFNPSLKVYETNTYWDPNIIAPARFLKHNSFYYDSYSGLSHDIHGNLTWFAPISNWQKLTSQSSRWSDFIE